MARILQTSQLSRDVYEEGDYKVGPSGDLATASGVDALLYRIDRMLVTNPGEIYHRPSWGIGIVRFLNQPNNANTAARLRNEIIRNVSADPDVEKVIAVGIKREDNGVIVSVRLIARGGLQVEQGYGFQIGEHG